MASCDGSTRLKSKIKTLTAVGSGLLRSPQELIARSRISTYYLAVAKQLAKLSGAKFYRNRLYKQALVAIPDALVIGPEPRGHAKVLISPTRSVWEARARGSSRAGNMKAFGG